MNKNATFQLLDSICITDVDNELVLLDFNSGRYFGLNQVGADFIHLAQQQLNFTTISQHIANKYQIQQSTVHHDLTQLIEQLVTEQLIITVD